MISPLSGRILLAGIKPAESRRTGKIGFAFQFPTLFPWRTALENVLLPLEILNVSKKPKENKHAIELLSMVGLKEAKDKLPHQLSGGMQQRVGLARSLVSHPDFLFLDEPFGQLDGITRDRLNVLVRKKCKELELTSIFVSHSIEEAIFLADYVIILSSRPARIIKIIEIDLEVNRDNKTRLHKNFYDYIKEVRILTEEE